MSNQQNKDRAEEMDLLQFLQWTGRGLNRFGRSLILGMARIRGSVVRNRRFFSVMVALGITAGAAYYYLSKEKFETSMVFNCEYLNTQILENHINKINELAEEKDKVGLARTLGINTDLAKKIVKLDAQPFVSEGQKVENEVLKEKVYNAIPEKKNVADQVAEKLESYNKNSYRLTATVLDPEIIDTLQSAIINYFTNNEFVNRRLSITRATLVARKEKLQRESRKLDSLKEAMYLAYQAMTTQSRGSNNVFLSDNNASSPLEIYKTDLDMHNQLLDIERKLFIREDFEVLDDFTRVQEPSNPGPLETVAIGALLSVVAGFLILGLVRFNQILSSYD